MLSHIRVAAKKTKKFIEEHPTLTACAVTFVVASKISHDVTLAGVIEQTTETAYQFGQQAGELQTYLDAAYTFINAKGLGHEFLNFTVPVAAE